MTLTYGFVVVTFFFICFCAKHYYRNTAEWYESIISSSSFTTYRCVSIQINWTIPLLSASTWLCCICCLNKALYCRWIVPSQGASNNIQSHIDAFWLHIGDIFNATPLDLAQRSPVGVIYTANEQWQGMLSTLSNSQILAKSHGGRETARQLHRTIWRAVASCGGASI